jgi:hypothetical protein
VAFGSQNLTFSSGIPPRNVTQDRSLGYEVSAFGWEFENFKEKIVFCICFFIGNPKDT